MAQCCPIKCISFSSERENILPQWAYNTYALEVSAQCTLQKTQDLNGHPVLCKFLVATLVNIQYSQHHTALTFDAKGFN
jgi:hypothetical protein